MVVVEEGSVGVVGLGGEEGEGSEVKAEGGLQRSSLAFLRGIFLDDETG